MHACFAVYQQGHLNLVHIQWLRQVIWLSQQPVVEASFEVQCIDPLAYPAISILDAQVYALSWTRDCIDPSNSVSGSLNSRVASMLGHASNGEARLTLARRLERFCVSCHIVTITESSNQNISETCNETFCLPLRSYIKIFEACCDIIACSKAPRQGALTSHGIRSTAAVPQLLNVDPNDGEKRHNGKLLCP